MHEFLLSILLIWFYNNVITINCLLFMWYKHTNKYYNTVLSKQSIKKQFIINICVSSMIHLLINGFHLYYDIKVIHALCIVGDTLKNMYK
jgi:hypothetical protein